MIVTSEADHSINSWKPWYAARVSASLFVACPIPHAKSMPFCPSGSKMIPPWAPATPKDDHNIIKGSYALFLACHHLQILGAVLLLRRIALSSIFQGKIHLNPPVQSPCHLLSL
jgi:hypothetical protein